MEPAASPPTNPLDMSIDTAIANYALLRALPAYTKLCVDRSTGKMTLENRWFPSTRRYITGDSRKDLTVPIERTFLLISRHPNFPAKEVDETIAHARNQLELLYPNIGPLFETINNSISHTNSVAERAEQVVVPTGSQNMATDSVIAVECGDAKETERLDTPKMAPVNTQETVRRRIPIDIRIDIDQFFDDEPTDKYEPHSEFCLYQVFPCLRQVVRWLRDIFSLTD